jgi:site-specific DNA-methyltransferase (adenine-specific)
LKLNYFQAYRYNGVLEYSLSNLPQKRNAGGEFEKPDIVHIQRVYRNKRSLYPDKHFDLAIIDPPYGIGKDWEKRNWKKYCGKKYPDTTHKNESMPDPAYFAKIERVSKNRIIWGYNYFTDILGPTNYLIVWDKVSGDNDVVLYSGTEIAYTSIKRPIRVISVQWDGYKMGVKTG